MMDKCDCCKNKDDEEIYDFICPSCGMIQGCEKVIDGKCICLNKHCKNYMKNPHD